MIFTPTEIPGVVVVDVDKQEDSRGFFGRSFCVEEFGAQGLSLPVVQCDVSFNRKKGTLRGLHYQLPPKAEVKLVRCTRGRLFDVAVDLRRESPTYCRWVGIELDADSHRAVFIPEGCAHGFQTLVDDCEVFYQMGAAYDPALARGVRCDDPAFAIRWPLAPTSISERDSSFPDFVP